MEGAISNWMTGNQSDTDMCCGKYSLNTWTGWCQWVRHKDWVIKGLIIPLKITYEQKPHQAM